MDTATALEFAGSRSKSTLVTIRQDGRPQVSNVLHVLDGDVVSMSLTDSRAKTRNLRADPRACLHVTDESFWQYVVLDGVVELSPVAADPHDATVDRLVDLLPPAQRRAPGLGRVPRRHGRRGSARRRAHGDERLRPGVLLARASAARPAPVTSTGETASAPPS